MTQKPPLATTMIGIFVVAAVATAGDYVWYTYGVEHRMSAGIVLLTSVGLGADESSRAERARAAGEPLAS